MSDAAEATAVETTSAGRLLRQAREAAGMRVAALAVSLKVPVRKLEALEEDHYEEMGDAVFIRGLASSVCRTLKIDPQPVLERLPQTAVPRLVQDGEGLNAPFRVPSEGASPGWREALIQPVPLAVLGLLVAAAAIYLLPNLPNLSSREEPTPTVSAAVPPAPTPVVASAMTTAPVATAASAPEAAPPVADASAPVVAAAPAQPAASAAVANGATVADHVAGAAPAGGIIVVRAKGESWVEVIDAKGAVGVRRLMAAGESAGASGALPLRVTIGKADMSEVRVRGKPFDLRPVSRDNIARFEVK